MTGIWGKADANCTTADAKTVANTRRTQNRHFPYLPYTSHMFTPLHTLFVFLYAFITPYLRPPKKKVVIARGFASAFASAKGGSGRKLRPPSVSPCVQLETSDKTFAAFAGPGGRKFWEDLPQCRHKQPGCFDSAISRRIHQPSVAVVDIAFFAVPIM